ncbi:hypothetical protein PHSY_004342 [Pseudozyma hubeiensis SY62]|uniref:Uncharacterized protein n=1 Tax=Pseudozyma hubeiensis (strain SY62) TaxID=1305764 RepID=R9P5S2_PSEHS|nr:hypothetical protein PHSY_004342 [Pseudozyma hubeiensis SY62]GAC96758.1 hypothetical protein PHSY_004342 [Pseudozyma hubeiensis SY62]
MNAQLLNPFTLDIPDSVSTTLSTAECSTLLFNHGSSLLSGQYLAVGRNDGYITIWDLETKSVLRVLAGHVRPVTGLAWSRYNRYLASCSGDWNVIVWDLASKSFAGPVLRSGGKGKESADGEAGLDPRLPCAGERKLTIRFDCAVASVQFAPGASGRLVVVTATQEAYLVDIRDKVQVGKKRRGKVQVKDTECSPTRIPLVRNSDAVQGFKPEPHSTQPEIDDTTATPTQAGITAARFTPDSRFIVAGTSKGSLVIYSALAGEFLDEQKVLSTTSGVKELCFDAAGRYLVVNCNDRALRILSVHTSASSSATKQPLPTLSLTLLHKIQDMIQRTAWNNIGFSPSSDYIFAGAAHKASHNVYIWDRTSSTLSKILEGPKDWSIGVDWHPSRPMLASASNTGAIYVWFTPTEEIWSAYAPGFEELEENMEYEEREDEFDFLDGRGESERKRLVEEEAAYVRISDRSEARGKRGGEKEGAMWKEVAQMLEVDSGEEKGKEWMAVKTLLGTRLEELSLDSGWRSIASAGVAPMEGSEEERWLEFTLTDDDDSDAFVIPPRLEIDYSDFHDDHI